MGKILNFFKPSSAKSTETKEESKPITGGKFYFLNEKLKGDAKTSEDKWSNLLRKDIGEEHPFDFAEARKWAVDDPFMSGVVEKFLDFSIGAGYQIECDDGSAAEEIEDFLTLKRLRRWVEEALTTGNGFMELAGKEDIAPDNAQILKSDNMYVKREKSGEIQYYTQYKGNREKSIKFKPYEIAHLTHRLMGDDAYGLGLVLPLGFILTKKTELIKHMIKVMERKANSPYHVIMGDRENGVVPSSVDLEGFKKKLDYLKREPNWVTDPYVKIETVDFGKIGDKFSEPLNQVNQELFFGSQVPAVLMGQAKVPEGLAKVQMDAFKRRVTAIQNEIEWALKEKIFPRFTDQDVTIRWGEPTQDEKRKDLNTYVEILKLTRFGAVDMQVVNGLNQRIADILELDIEVDQDQELGMPAKPDPEKEPAEEPEEEHSHVSLEEDFEYSYDLTESQAKRDYTLQEWTGKDYVDEIGLENINFFLESYRFPEIANLKDKQINRLRLVLMEAFEKGNGIQKIAKDVREIAKIGTLEVPATADRKGYTINSRTRSVAIARTETIRASAEGTLERFKKEGIKKAEWIASHGDRTCPICDANDGMVAPVAEMQGMIPAHVSCRCSFAPYTDIKP